MTVATLQERREPVQKHDCYTSDNFIVNTSDNNK